MENSVPPKSLKPPAQFPRLRKGCQAVVRRSGSDALDQAVPAEGPGPRAPEHPAPGCCWGTGGSFVEVRGHRFSGHMFS